MPKKFASAEERRAYNREMYRRNREDVIAKVRFRKYNQYSGICLNCGGVTVGANGPGSASDYCGKPLCKSAQMKGTHFVKGTKLKG